MKRLIMVICCNDSGFKKIILWFISKYTRPWCFKNMNLNSINYEYRVNKQACMMELYSRNMFDNLIKKWMVESLLLANNCLAYLKPIEGLKNIKLFFLSPNTT